MAFAPGAPLLSISYAETRITWCGRHPIHHVKKISRMSRASMVAGGLSYADSGVDIDVEGASVAALIRGLQNTPTARDPGQLGAPVKHPVGFAGLIEFDENLLAICTDGVGSKLMLAAELNYYETVASDCVAMNVNDLLCIGAEPLAFVDYIAAPRPDPRVWEALGRSLGKACREAKVSLCGGETATLPQMVKEIDMSGTALGWVPKGSQIDGKNIAAGDIIIGLASSGVHSNGFSLVRKILEQGRFELRDELPFVCEDKQRARGGVQRHTGNLEGGVTIGEVLMNPTCIYVDPVSELLQLCRKHQHPCEYKDIHGIAHITGGGLSNLLRLNSDAGFRIDNPLPVLPEFEWMQKVAMISSFEMYRTFNMGMGMALIVSRNVAAKMVNWIRERFEGVRVVGEVDGSGVVTHVPTGVVLDKY